MHEWAKITLDPEILKTIKGLTLQYLEEPSVNKVGMKSGKNSPQIMSEVNKLRNKSLVINPAHPVHPGKSTFLPSQKNNVLRVHI